MTSVLKLVHKDLTSYAASEMLKWCIAHWEDLSRKSDEAAFRSYRHRWRDHADMRGNVGDGIHNYLEAEQTGSWEFPDLNEEQEQILLQWEDLKSVHDIVPLRNEITVGDRDLGWMGTYDSYCILDGKKTIVDFKTSKNIYDTAYMQVAALMNAKEWYIETSDMHWDVIEPEPVEQGAVFHLRADHWAVITLNDPSIHYEKFRRYCELWYMNDELKKIEKAAKA